MRQTATVIPTDINIEALDRQTRSFHLKLQALKAAKGLPVCSDATCPYCPEAKVSKPAPAPPTDDALLAIASTATRKGDVFEVRSSSSDTVYYTTAQFCSCPSFRHRGGPCKHQLACELLCPLPSPKAYNGDPFANFD